MCVSAWRRSLNGRGWTNRATLIAQCTSSVCAILNASGDPRWFRASAHIDRVILVDTLTRTWQFSMTMPPFHLFLSFNSDHFTPLDAYKINNLIRKKKKKKFIRIRCVSLIWIDKFGINFNIKLVFFLGKIDENKRRTEFFWSLFLDSEKSL